MDANNITVASTGGVYWLGTDSSWVPTTANSEVPAEAVGPMLLDDAGVEITPTVETNDIATWQLGAARTVVTNAYVEATFNIAENLKYVRELYYGSEEVDGVIDWNPAKRKSGKVVIDAFDNTDEANLSHIRHYFPRATVTEVAPLSISASGAVLYGLTIRFYRDAKGSVGKVLNSKGFAGDITDPENPTVPEVLTQTVSVQGDDVNPGPFPAYFELSPEGWMTMMAGSALSGNLDDRQFVVYGTVTDAEGTKVIQVRDSDHEPTFSGAGDAPSQLINALNATSMSINEVVMKPL